MKVGDLIIADKMLAVIGNPKHSDIINKGELLLVIDDSIDDVFSIKVLTRFGIRYAYPDGFSVINETR